MILGVDGNSPTSCPTSPLTEYGNPLEQDITIPPPKWNSIPESKDIYTIRTEFDPSKTDNKKFKYPRSNNSDRFLFTEQERVYAKKAKCTKDIKEFDTFVC